MVRLRDGLSVLWRERGASQVGADPRCGVILDGLTDADQHVLDLLARAPSVTDLIRAGRLHGIAPERVRALVETLGRAGVLSPDTVPPAPAQHAPPGVRLDAAAGQAADVAYWSRLRADGDGWAVRAGRAARTVAVMGVGRLGMHVATGLAVAGVGCLLLVDDRGVLPADVAPGAFGLDDVGRTREEAGARILGAIPGVTTSAPLRTRPDVTVLVEHGVASPVRSRPLVREDLSHLSVVVGEVDITVGPLVLPGQGACLRCLDLHRCDADERWPAVATQIAAEPGDGVEATLAPLAAALAVGQVVAHLDGRPADVLGAALEVSAVEPVPRRREWSVHPDCGCTQVGPPAITGSVGEV